MSFWRDKKVIVSGGSGFLGSRIVTRLEAQGANVSVPRSNDLDLVKPDCAWKMLDRFTPDTIIHCAAVCGGIGLNREKPGTLFYQNLMMGTNVLHMAHLFKVRKVVTIGTICEYPKLTKLPFREADLWEGYPDETNAPYGIAKKAILTMGQAYRNEHKMSVIHLLPVNLYGPGDNFNQDTSHVIPALIRRFYDAKQAHKPDVVCWGTGDATREFLHVDDAADAIMIAAEKYDKPSPLNIGAGFEISIADLATLISKFIGYRGQIRWDVTKPDGQPRRCLDTSRAWKELGWRASMKFEEGLAELVAWYIETRNT